MTVAGLTPAAMQPRRDCSEGISAPRSTDGRQGNRFWMVTFFIAATLASLAYIRMAKPEDLNEQPAIAVHLAKGHGFLSPVDPSPHALPTSWATPVYPYLMAAVYQVFGIESPTSLRILLSLNAVCLGIIAAVVYWLGARLFGPGAGIWAAVVLLAHPAFIRRTNSFWDTNIALAMFACMLAAAVSIRRNGCTWGKMIALGAGMGLLALTKCNYAATYPVVVLYAIGPSRWRRKFALSAAALAVFLAVITPWTIRNYQSFHKLFFLRDGFTVELWMGNQPGTYGWMMLDGHPNSDPTEGRRLQRLGETRYFALEWDRFRAEYAYHPGWFWTKCLWRIFFLFVGESRGHPHAALRYAMDAFFSLLGLAGAWAAYRLRYHAGWILAAGALSVSPYIVSHVCPAYSLSLRLALAIFGGFLIASVWNYLRRGTWPASPRALHAFGQS